jgi:hypothetical protein
MMGGGAHPTSRHGCHAGSLEVLELIGLPAFPEKIVPPGREEIPWSVMALRRRSAPRPISSYAFLAYVVLKTIGQICMKAGLGDEPRQVFDEIAQIEMVDVVLHTTNGQSPLKLALNDQR